MESIVSIFNFNPNIEIKVFKDNVNLKKGTVPYSINGGPMKDTKIIYNSDKIPYVVVKQRKLYL